jgi:hypothetical protein
MTIPGPNQSQSFNPAPVPASVPAAQPKKKKKWPWIVGIGAALIIFANMGGGDSDDGPTNATGPTETVESVEAVEAVAEPEQVRKEAPVEEDAPAEEEQPAELQAGQAGETGGMQVTVSNIRFASDILGSYICADADLLNNDDRAQRFSQFDFELEKPNGVVADTTITGLEIRNLEMAELNPGGNTNGTICFDSDGTAGAHKVSYTGAGFFSQPLTWSVNL